MSWRLSPVRDAEGINSDNFHFAPSPNASTNQHLQNRPTPYCIELIAISENDKTDILDEVIPLLSEFIGSY